MRDVPRHAQKPPIRHGHERLMASILRRRANFSAYDATYVTLTESLSASLLSADRRLLRATGRHTKVRSAREDIR